MNDAPKRASRAKTAAGPTAGERPSVPGFEVQLVCANGHLLNDWAQAQAAPNAKFCPECGEGTLSRCPECDTPLRGRFLPEGAEREPDGGKRIARAPRYCHECGSPFPWTAERLLAADELAAQLDDLSDEERRLLRAAFRDILTENPRTEVAALRIKRAAEHAGKGASRILFEVVENLASETAKRLILGP